MTTNRITTYSRALFFLSIAVFFCCVYNYHLLFEEQTQVFQWTWLYAADHLYSPGGIVTWLGGFITQFYIWNHVGGVLITWLLIAAWSVQNRIILRCVSGGTSLFSLLLPLLLSLYLTDTKSTTAGVVALLLLLLAAWGTVSVRRPWVSVSIALCALPLLYWATAGGVWIYLSVCVVYGLLRRPWGIPISVLVAVGGPLLLFLEQRYLPLSTIGMGVGTLFYRTTDLPPFIYLLMGAPAAIMVSDRIVDLCIGANQHRRSISVGATLLWSGLAVGLLFIKADRNEENIYALDHLLRRGQWKSLVERAETDPQRNLVFVSYVNVALLNRNELPQRMMHFSQRPEINEFWTPDYLPMFLTGETYYTLGMNDAARAYLFMANTQSPRGESPFMYQRLAELECVRGCPASAMKFVQALKHTLFYRRWALEMEQSILTRTYPPALREKIERYRPDDTFLAKEMTYNVALELQSNPHNRAARHFLMARYLLANDYKGFLHCLHSIPPDELDSLPHVWREFLLMYAYMTRDHSLIDRWKIDKTMVNNFSHYLDINQSGQPEEVIKKRLTEEFGRTYWFYLQYKNEF